MNPPVLSVPAGTTATPGAIDAWLRGRVLRSLAPLRHGELVIEDAWGRRRLGEGDGANPVHVRVADPRDRVRALAGRAAPGTLVWGRSNRSMRAFDLTVDALAAGHQPPLSILGSICYLMRNTGLDGNGTFGTRTFAALEPDHPLRRPLHAQLLTAYLMREFSFDLVEDFSFRLRSYA